jgi:hypothetical protein
MLRSPVGAGTKRKMSPMWGATGCIGLIYLLGELPSYEVTVSDGTGRSS